MVNEEEFLQSVIDNFIIMTRKMCGAMTTKAGRCSKRCPYYDTIQEGSEHYCYRGYMDNVYRSGEEDSDGYY